MTTTPCAPDTPQQPVTMKCRRTHPVPGYCRPPAWLTLLVGAVFTGLATVTHRAVIGVAGIAVMVAVEVAWVRHHLRFHPHTTETGIGTGEGDESGLLATESDVDVAGPWVAESGFDGR
jgi:hypothetical protein